MAKFPCLAPIHPPICAVRPRCARAVPVGKIHRAHVPPLCILPSLLLHHAEWARGVWASAMPNFQVWPVLWCKRARAWAAHLEEFASIPPDTPWFTVYTLKMMELRLHNEPYHQPFLAFNKYICSPKTLLTLEQNYPSKLLLFSVGIFKNKNFLQTIQEPSVISEQVHEQAPGVALANMPWFRNSHSMNIFADETVL